MNSLGARAVEISCLTCPTWAHFIQDKLEISTYSSLDKFKCKKVNTILHFIVWVNYWLTCCIENSVDPDQLASSEAS